MLPFFFVFTYVMADAQVFRYASVLAMHRNFTPRHQTHRHSSNWACSCCAVGRGQASTHTPRATRYIHHHSINTHKRPQGGAINAAHLQPTHRTTTTCRPRRPPAACTPIASKGARAKPMQALLQDMHQGAGLQEPYSAGRQGAPQL